MITLDQLNGAATRAEFAALLEGTYEHSPWIAERAFDRRPFRSVAQLQHAFAVVLREAGRDAQLALIRAHPELAGKAMVRRTLTDESAHEQSKAGLTDCSPAEFERLQRLNAAYNEKFGWPFILAVRGPRGTGLTRQQILDTFERRLANPADFEFAECLRNIHRVVELRLADKFGVELTLGNQAWDCADKLATWSDPPWSERGELTVTYLTDAHRACQRQLLAWMKDCGFDEARIDAVGNVVGVYHGADPKARRLLTGSHYDTVRNGGRFDGRLGIFVPLVAVRELQRAGRRLPFGLEVVGFAEEEGQRYKATFLGSGALTGHFDPSWLEQRDADGVSMREAMRAAGLPAALAAIAAETRDASRYLGFVEVHIEQGPVLNALDLPLGIVTSINGGVRYLGTATGTASHAGTTPMTMRRDASWRCSSNGERRRCPRSSAPSACSRCPAAPSTWCPGAAASRSTSARRRTRRVTPVPPTCWPKPSASASGAVSRSPSRRRCARLPRRATRRCSGAGRRRSRRSACRCTACPRAQDTTR
jgi:N-carbamoyl-L-amino-acid hydrolase